MLRNKLVRSDGSIIDSSVIISCEYTEEVNSSTNLSVGDVTSSELTVEILSTTPIQQGEILTYYVIEDGVEKQVGIFNVEKPTVATRTTMKFSAYDNVIKTEKNFSDWLRGNQSAFPMTLDNLVQVACDHCGVTRVESTLPNADLSINAFYADDITCRQILAWAGAIMGRFVRTNAAGEIEFAWYRSDANVIITPSKSDQGSSIEVIDDGKGNLSINSTKLSVTDDGAGNVTMIADGLVVETTDAGINLYGSIVLSFRRDSLSYDGYTTDLIERVQIKHSDDDVGVIYPVDVTGNCFTISRNMILGTCSTEQVLEVATSLHTHLKDATYVPFSVTVGRTLRVRAGDIVSITDSTGNVFTSYVMKVSMTPGGTTLSATGDKSYGTNAAVSSEQYSNLTGKILEIKQSVDGLVIKNQDLQGRVAGLELSTESYKTYVEKNFVSDGEFNSYRTEAEQTAEGFEERFKRVEGSLQETDAHIKRGVLYYNEDNVPVYGIEIGQTTEVAGEKVFDKFAQFTSEKLSFYDQGGNEVTQIGDSKMSVTNIEVVPQQSSEAKEYGTFKQGGYMDITQADGSIITKWVGGG